jgi:hypothetical protein
LASISGGDSESRSMGRHNSTWSRIFWFVAHHSWAVLFVSRETHGLSWKYISGFLLFLGFTGTGKGTNLVISDNVHILYRVWGVFGTSQAVAFSAEPNVMISIYPSTVTLSLIKHVCDEQLSLIKNRDDASLSHHTHNSALCKQKVPVRLFRPARILAQAAAQLAGRQAPHQKCPQNPNHCLIAPALGAVHLVKRDRDPRTAGPSLGSGILVVWGNVKLIRLPAPTDAPSGSVWGF